ncbi:MAG: cytochrome-c oxidase, cbb3-type subunit II [Cyanobacteria bacterium NC_groundwater_1444_Ag_S-0.65um_54_12]|nr:cytochrome-c oxidase, cbb3-type subunit II [Cyanobacteria bacterium NC_groundwater_1444_Ag_S-0.65um_54_12]
MEYRPLERHSSRMVLLATVAVSIGGLGGIIPLFFLKDSLPPVADVKPYSALALAGRDIYLREGCVNCHSQMIRPFRAETDRYGPYSRMLESRYDHPVLWGAKRKCPDLARIGGKYPDDWHVQHMRDPQIMAPGSVMPPYPWLERTPLDNRTIVKKMRTMRRLGVPYSDSEIAHAPAALQGKSELAALIAYLQSLGTAVRNEHGTTTSKITVRNLPPSSNQADDLLVAIGAKDQVLAGRKIYREFCTGCHGETGHGLIGPALLDRQEWTYGTGKPEDIAKVIREGTSNGMPAWAKHFNYQKTAQITAFVHSLSHPADPYHPPLP